MSRELIRTLYRLTVHAGLYTLHEQKVYVVDVEVGGQAVEIVSRVLKTDMEEEEATKALAARRRRGR